MVWNKDTEPNPVLPSPSDYGWAMENAEWVPVMTTLSPAPEAVIELVRCAGLELGGGLLAKYQ